MRRVLLLLFAWVLLSGCASHPDLVRLYENASDDPRQPPVIVLHGLAGSTLVDAKTGKEFWPGGLSHLAFSNYRDLAEMSDADREGEGLVPGTLTYGVAGVDFYADLLRTLETVGRFEKGVPGQKVGANRRRYYVFVYDWRRDNVRSVIKLHELIEQIRRDYDDPALKVDLIAHSNGGAIANYYLRYGPHDVLDGDGDFPAWSEGDARIRRLVMLGTPSLGAVTSLERLIYGMRVGLGTVPVEVMATFVTPYQALPHPLARPVLDVRGVPVDIDLYDPAVWQRERWGVYSPEVMSRVRGSMGEPIEGERAVADLQARFARNLRRAERMAWALTAPLPPNHVETAVFGGDCEATPGHAVMLREGDGTRLVFRPAQVTAGHDNANGGRGLAPTLDYTRLMMEPGDGLVTRSSQVARRPIDLTPADDARFHPLPPSQTFFLCESHGRLTHNLYFQNNLLYFLLARLAGMNGAGSISGCGKSAGPCLSCAVRHRARDGFDGAPAGMLPRIGSPRRPSPRLMDPLRTLLIDCRIELRKLVREFHKTELCERLDAMVGTLQRTPVQVDPAEATPNAAAQKEIKETASQVALAWQSAARDLKFTNAPLYDQLQKRVIQRLESKSLQDPADEIRALEAQVERLHAQLGAAESATAAVENERNAVLGALATAVPQLGDGGDRLGVALARVQWLQDQVVRAAPTMAVRAASEDESRIPSNEVISMVATGARRFTDAQREWCVGEAMVLSNFQYTPMELIGQGDARIATIIHQARTGPAAN